MKIELEVPDEIVHVMERFYQVSSEEGLQAYLQRRLQEPDVLSTLRKAAFIMEVMTGGRKPDAPL